MSDPASRPTAPPAGSIDRLLDAAVEELREGSYAELTIRKVARRAGVSTATAYNYVSSKEHLFAAVHLRSVQRLPRAPVDDRPVEERLAGLVQDLADEMVGRPELQAAFRAALLGDDPDSRRVRDTIFDEFAGRFREACGDDLDDTAADTVLFSFVGAMILAGMGRLPFTDIGRRVAGVVTRIR